MNILEILYLSFLAVLCGFLFFSSRRFSRKQRAYEIAKFELTMKIFKLEKMVALYSIEPNLLIIELEKLIKEAKEVEA